MKLVQRHTGFWLTLGWLLLLVSCATPVDVGEQNFRLLAPSSIKQSVTVLLKIETNQAGLKHHWEAVLNIDATHIDLVILSTLGRRLATLGFDGQKLTVKHSSSIEISLKKLLGQLQMIYWPLVTLNTDKKNQSWYFKQQNQMRYVYYQQQLVAEIQRRQMSLWSGDFDYTSRISDYRLTIRSSQLDQ
ncbi:MAG: DUF3261 domain-containing protein [Gammaproteobacteria bacterium]